MITTQSGCITDQLKKWDYAVSELLKHMRDRKQGF